MQSAIVHTEWVDVLGSNVDLAGAEIDLISLPRREYRLKDVLDRVQEAYDFVIIDCPPSLEKPDTQLSVCSRFLYGAAANRVLCAGGSVAVDGNRALGTAWTQS